MQLRHTDEIGDAWEDRASGDGAERDRIKRRRTRANVSFVF